MKQRLELTWIGKEERPRLEPRILLEDPELSWLSGIFRGDDVSEKQCLMQTTHNRRGLDRGAEISVSRSTGYNSAV